MTPVLKTLTRCAFVATWIAGCALTASAQTSPEAPKSMPSAATTTTGNGHSAQHMGMHARSDPAKMEGRVTKHLAELKTKLKITTAQEGSWTAFTAAMKPPARADMDRPDREAMDKLTTPERIDKMRSLRTQHATERQANMEKRENAVKALYSELNAEQKTTFDAEHSKMLHRWGDHMKTRHDSAMGSGK